MGWLWLLLAVAFLVGGSLLIGKALRADARMRAQEKVYADEWRRTHRHERGSSVPDDRTEA